MPDLITQVTLVDNGGWFVRINVDSVDETTVRLAAQAAKDALMLIRSSTKREWFIEEYAQILKEEN